MIIENGPVSGGILSWSHAMALVGFETDSTDGKVVWIFKNSWGKNWGGNLSGGDEGGYAFLKLDINDIEWTHAIQLPITSTNGYQINCVDKDNDQFCNWGISKNKPATCPAFCKTTPDCDDSNSNLATFDANYNCVGGDNPLPLEKIFTIYNDGNADLVINSITPETAVPWLSVLASTPFTISPGSSKAVPVQITAAAPSGTVRLLVNSNDPDENPYPNGVNIEIRRRSGSVPIPTQPLPSLNNELTAPLASGASTIFTGGIAVNGQPPQSTAVLNLSDTVAITGQIVVAATDVGKTADIFVYAEATLPPSEEKLYFMLGEGLAITQWDQNSSHLAAFMPQVTLNAIQSVPMYSGHFIYPGTLKVYFGYRLTDGTLVSNQQPIDIVIN